MLTTFEKKESDLVIKLTQQGREEIEQILTEEGLDAIRSDKHFDDFIEYELCNSDWHRVSAEQIGALTSNPFIFSDDIELDQDDDVVMVKTLYWFDAYATQSIMEQLLRYGEVVLKGERA